VLTDIEGIGNANAQKLFWKFRSVKNIRSANLEELQEVIGKAKGQIVFQYFASRDDNL
jgi:excinuclease ABC subunit C